MSPELLKILLTLSGGIFSLLLLANVFFIKRLVTSIDNASQASSTALSQIALLNRDFADVKEAVKEIPNIKTDVAVIKNSIDNKRILNDIHNKLSRQV